MEEESFIELKDGLVSGGYDGWNLQGRVTERKEPRERACAINVHRIPSSLVWETKLCISNVRFYKVRQKITMRKCKLDNYQSSR